MIKRLVSALSLLSLVTTNAFSQSKTISGGNDHGLIICAQGYLYTWGNNMDKTIGGPLLGIDPDDAKDGGEASKDFVYKPSRVKTGNLTFSMVTSGSGAFNLALSCYKVVYGWGDNQQGGCGQGGNGENVVKYPTPVLKGETSGYTVDGQPGGDYLGGVTYIAASTNSGFAIMNDGRVVGWGTGKWNAKTGAGAKEPSYIKFKDGTDVKNVTHISGGDDNLLIRTADGKLYGIGPWNGSGKEAAVTYATPVLKEEDGEPLTDIRMSAAGDVCGFAVTGDGYVWSWGNGGWGGSTGQQQQGLTHYGALRVSAGEYSTISGEEYLTDVKEVIGGRGHGAAVTKEGYLVYWGCNEGNGGVAPVDAATAKEWNSGAQGVLPVLARYCDASGKPGPLVDNAVNISRGDNFDFMVNDKDEYYVWGKNDLGQAGTGDATVKSYTCLQKLETIPCEIQDACPTVFMIDRIKCPGEKIELDCGYVIPKGKEERYFVSWWHDGKLLNTSSKKDDKATRLADEYNVASIFITEPGEYKVKVEYIGTNIPCDACEPDSTTITVKDMDMPIDTVITSMNCVAEPLKPSATDNICYEFTVNSSFYKADQKATFAIFSTEDSKDTLDKYTANGSGGVVKFCVSGDKIGKTEVHDNKDEESADTTYTIWVEDMSSFETYLFEDSKGSMFETGGSFQSYGLMIDAYADADLKSFDIAAKSYSGEAEISVTPTVYLASKNTNGMYVVGDVFWKGKAQTFTVDASGPNLCTVKCDVRLPGSAARGVRYIIGMSMTGNCTLYNFDAPKTKQNSPEFLTPIIDSEKFGIYAFGATANSYTSQSNGSDKLCYANVLFGKLTDYDCGRMKLTAKYGCPPCNQPDGIIEIASTVDVTPGVEIDTVALCKETGSTVLSVADVVKASEPSASFDIIWSNERTIADASALLVDAEKSASKITVNWEDIPEGESKTYYLKIRDHEKPEASACWVLDSIVVKANKVPEVPTIDVDPFCSGKLTDAEIAEIVEKFFSIEGYESKLEGAAGELTSAAFAAELKDAAAGTYDYTLTLTDKVTGCVSEPTPESITINANPEVPAVNELAMLKETGAVESVAPGAVAAEGCTISWATKKDMSDAVTTAPKQDKSEAGTFIYYVKQINDLTGCESDTTHFVVVVNDAPKPNTRDTVICKGETVDMSSRVTALSAEYTLYWYTSLTDAKGTGSSTTPTFTETVPGKYTYYVSQMNNTTKAESEKSEFNVTVIGVDPATVLVAEKTYCQNATDAVSVETMVSASDDNASYIFADGMEWKLAGVTPSSLIPNTDVKVSTTYLYSATQTYVIPSSGAVCKGTPVEVAVNVTVLDAPLGDLSVNYLKSDASDNGGKFKDLVSQNPNVATASPDCSLQWYDASGNPLPAAPSPAYDPNQVEDVEYIYYVSQKNAMGCESEKSKVVVTISSSPMPTPNHVAFCEKDPDALTAPLTANIQTTGSGADTPDDYELVWYGLNNPNDVSSAAEKEALEVGSAPVPANTITDGSAKQVYVYYVAQKSKKTGAVSRAIAIGDTVYAAPVLSTENPKPVCEPATVDLSSDEIWHGAVPQNWVMAWLDESQTNPLSAPTQVAKSGTYYAQAYFNVQGKRCVSNLAGINVEVHYVRGLKIEGPRTTCPNTSVQLNAVTDEVNPAAQVSYTWTCAGNGDVKTVSSASYETPALAGPAFNTYTYNLKVSAGECKGIDGGNHTISIGDGPVEGSVSFSEEGNSESRNETVNSDGLTFYSCGNPITIDLSKVENTEDDFVWTVAGGKVAEGDVFTIAEPTNTTYHIAYTNSCATGFDITIVSVPVTVTPTNTSTTVCEGDGFSAELNVACAENTYKITWYQDNNELVGQTLKTLSFNPATTDNNGVYSYKVTNRGCVVEGNIADGTPVQVKPYIKVTAQPTYVARRDSMLSVPLNITVPAATEPSSIIWKEESGVQFSEGNPLSLKVTANHNFTVELSDDNYCPATTRVNVFVDARLQLKASLEEEMCASDTRELIIDTTGTGTILDITDYKLTVIETVDGVDTERNDFGYNNADGLLHLVVSPKSDAIYTVYSSYHAGKGVDEQIVRVVKKLRVLPPVEVVLPDEPLQICGDGENSITVALKSVSPAGTIVTWDDDEAIVSGKEGNSIEVSPIFDETKEANVTYWPFTVHAQYSICSSVTKTVSVRVDRPLSGVVVGPEVICENTQANIDASAYNAESYTWTSPDDERFLGAATGAITVSPEYSAIYEVEMKRGECSAEDSWAVSVSQSPEIVSVDSLGFHIREVQVNGGVAPLNYWLDNSNGEGSLSNRFEGVEYGKHKVFVVDAAGCSADTQIVVKAPGLIIPIVVSPEGDGINEEFSNEVIREAYPDATIRIYDRWGKLLTTYKGADPGWNGVYNGKNMPSTDYWYEIEIKELKTTYTGHFTLLRQ